MGIIKSNRFAKLEERKIGYQHADETDFIKLQKAHRIEFYHTPSGHSVSFKAFLKSFSDEFKQNWDEDAVYGRMDNIQKYQGTTRTINLAWEVPAHGIAEAARNSEAISKLASFQYPGYDDVGPLATTISSPPLIKVLMMNKIIKPGGNPAGTARESGLLCKMEGFSPEWDVDEGAFDPEPGIIFPKLWRCSAQLTVLHTHSLGWKGDKLRQGGKGFPYNVETFKESESVSAPNLDRIPAEVVEAFSESVFDAADSVREFFDDEIG